MTTLIYIYIYTRVKMYFAKYLHQHKLRGSRNAKSLTVSSPFHYSDNKKDVMVIYNIYTAPFKNFSYSIDSHSHSFSLPHILSASSFSLTLRLPLTFLKAEVPLFNKFPTYFFPSRSLPHLLLCIFLR